jgi:hypothetical protein
MIGFIEGTISSLISIAPITSSFSSFGKVDFTVGFMTGLRTGAFLVLLVRSIAVKIKICMINIEIYNESKIRD